MIWMCGEPCYETKKDLEEYTKILKQNAHNSITDISYELYVLDDHSQIIKNNVTDVTTMIKGIIGVYGKPIGLYPMIVGFNIERIRELFENPDGFIKKSIELCKENEYTGINIDFEPPKEVVKEDSKKLIKFMDLYTKKMKENGFEVQIDYATWSIFWNTSGLSKISDLSSLYNMQTYARDLDVFKHELDKSLDDVGVHKLGVGLASYVHLTDEEVVQRFEYMKSKSVKRVSVWRFMYPAFSIESQWWNSLSDFVNS